MLEFSIKPMPVTPAINVLNTAAGLSILLCYISMIQAGRKDGAIGVPLSVAILYVAWDLNWLVENVRFAVRGGPLYIFMLPYVLWPFLSLPLLALVAREQARLYLGRASSQAYATAGAVLVTATAMAATGAELGFYRGLINLGYIVAMSASAIFLGDLLRFADPRGKRLSILAFRAVGVQMFVIADLMAQFSPLPAVTGAVCLLLDGIYAAKLATLKGAPHSCIA